MKDYLPLLIGLIWLGFTLYNKKQKGKSSKAGDVTEKRRPSMLEQLLLGEQFSELVQPEAEVSETVYETYDENVNNDEFETNSDDNFDEQTPFLQYELSNIAGEDTKIVDKNNSNKNKYNEVIIEEENNSQLIDFDLKRAVIYSEILHAPYI